MPIMLLAWPHCIACCSWLSTLSDAGKEREPVVGTAVRKLRPVTTPTCVGGTGKPLTWT